jgi:hypothetical protein
MSKPHPTCTKANECTFELACFRVNVKLHRAVRVRMLNFFAVLGERGIRVSVQTIDEFDRMFSGSIYFVVADIDSVKVLEMVLDDLGLDGWIGADFGKYFGGNELRVDVRMSVVMDPVASMCLNQCSDLPSICGTHGGRMKISKQSVGSRCVEIPEAFRVLAFDRVSLTIHFYRNEFEDIKKGGTSTSMFESREAIERCMDRKLR